jgi:hypothetical protein
MSPGRRGGQGSPRVLRGRPGELPAALEGPEIRRGIALNRTQWIAVPLLLVLPVLALAGFAGDREGEASARGTGLALRVTYPEWLHYSTNRSLTAAVTNLGSEALSPVVVRFDAEYLEAFTNLRIRTGTTRDSPEGVDVELPALAPGATAEIHLDVQGERYGPHRGRIAAVAAGGNAVRVEVGTLVLP